MAQDTVDSAIFSVINNARLKKVPSIEALNSEMPCKENQRDRGVKIFRYLLNRMRLKKYASVTISRPDPVYRVAYLGNVVTGWAKGEGCVEKPLATLWRNYTQSSRPDVRMQLTVSSGGLKVTTKDHGLTEYWANRLTTCAAPSQFPRLFCWVYRHEGKRLRHELRCHAVLCPSSDVARQIENELKESLALALQEFKREKISRQNARLSLVNSVYENPTIPRRKILLCTGAQNYRPPLERSKSAPKLPSIEEFLDEEEIFHNTHRIYSNILKLHDSSTRLLTQRQSFVLSKIGNMEEVNPSPHPEETVRSKSCTKVKFEESTTSDDLILNEQSQDLILEELAQSSMRNDLLESCERAWYSALGEKPDLIPSENDDGSISSGCESSTSTNLSESESPFTFPPINEETQEELGEKKTEIEFKVGGACSPRVSSYEKVQNLDLLKCSLYNHKNSNILGLDEVSLVPVGENSSDFSSLKIYKKRNFSESNMVYSILQTDQIDGHDKEVNDEGEESGYEDEVTSSIGSIILV